MLQMMELYQLAALYRGQQDQQVQRALLAYQVPRVLMDIQEVKGQPEQQDLQALLGIREVVVPQDIQEVKDQQVLQECAANVKPEQSVQVTKSKKKTII